MSSVVTMLLPTRKKLMITAAASSSFFALRMRPSGRSGVSPGSPCSSGMTATPVSNPERPSASLGRQDERGANMAHGLPCEVKSAAFQSPNAPGWWEKSW